MKGKARVFRSTRELLDGAEVKMPPTGMTFKQAQRMKEPGATQKSLFD